VSSISVVNLSILVPMDDDISLSYDLIAGRITVWYRVCNVGDSRTVEFGDTSYHFCLSTPFYLTENAA
jgi:hypothetical protein